MEENQLALIVEQSGLEKSKAQVMLDTFQDYFKIAAEWEVKAKAIVVTDASQTGDMAMAQQGRLFLRDKRITIEKTRKDLKEQSLREGKAIDGIANVLKALIVPIEEHLAKQENFVKLKAEAEVAEKAEQERVEAERKEEADRIAREEAERKERERIQAENEKLRQEAEVREKKAVAERAKHEAEQKAADDKLQEERERAQVERDKADKEAAKLRYREELKRKRLNEKAAKQKAESDAKLEVERKEKRKIEQRLAAQIECPKCGHKFIPNKEVIK